MRVLRILLGALLLAVSVCSISAQSLNTSQISGTVEDASGAAIPNATVTLRKTDTGLTRKVVTNSVGQYVAPDLPLGPYTIEVTAPGFRTYRAQGIVLQVGTNPAISPKLEPGEVTQQVTVEAIAPEQVETESNGVGEVIGQQQVVELPLNGRDPTQLISLAGATTPAPSGDLNSNKNYPTVTLAVAGGLPNGISYVLDGGTYNDVFNNLNLPIPFPDALQEFKVETSDLPAQYGDHSSAAINAITKSGGNQFHGDVFEFVRNYMFNARNFFAKSRDSLKRNQFGGVIGGPIKRDKLFFFAGFQGTIIRSNPNGNVAFVPTQDMLNGNFNPAIDYVNPATGKNCYNKAPGSMNLGGGFSGNTINPSQYNQQALNAIKAGIPVVSDPSNPCGVFDYPLSQNSTAQQIIGRVDWTLSPKHSLYARYFIGRFNSPVTLQKGDLLSANEVAQLNQDQSTTIGDTYIFSPNVINSVRLTGNRTLGLRTLQPFFDPSMLGINDYVTPAVKGFMGLSITNGFSIGQGANNPGYFNSTVYQIADDVNFIRGRHQFSFGGNYLYAYMNTVNNRPTNGGFSFNGTIVGAGSVGYADFLTGNMSSFFQGNPDYENDVYDYVGIYGQDSWKATQHLTVNYGLRWEPYIPFWNRNSHAEHFDPTAYANGLVSTVYPLAPAGMSFPGDPGFHGRSYNGGKIADFAPRVGLVYIPDQVNHWSIRAGFGIFYDSPQMFFDTRYSNSPPWGQTVTLNGKLNFTNPWATYPGGQDPFPGLSHVSASTPFVKNGTYVNEPWAFTPMSMEQWDLSVQHQMKDWLVSVSYLGNRTLHLPTAYEANPAVYIPGNSTGAAGSCGAMNPVPAAGTPCSTLTNTTARRALTLENAANGAYYQTIGQLDDEGNANYNGMLAAVQHQSHSLTLSVNYTYSHCLSEAATTELTGPTYNIPGDRHASYSNCDSDRRQLLNSTMVYFTPRLQSHLRDLAFGGWGVSSIFTARSGGWFSVFTGIDNSLTGINTTSQVAIRTGSPYASRTNFGAGNYVSRSAFSSPANGTFTTAPPLTILGPPSYGFDMALLRNFHIREAQTLQFRWEVFNVLNEAAFTGTSSNGGGNSWTLTSSTFGQFLSASDPRIMQFALKYNF